MTRAMSRNKIAFSLTFLGLCAAVLIAFSTGKYPIDPATFGRLFLSLIGVEQKGAPLEGPALVLCDGIACD